MYSVDDRGLSHGNAIQELGNGHDGVEATSPVTPAASAVAG